MMLVQEIILKKRNKNELTEEEIWWFINTLCEGKIDSSQIGAFLMSVWFNKMTEKEKVALTLAMVKSGSTIDWNLPGPIVDKHSTGGVGDTISLILAPILACLGCYVPMISGRGLGHTGGTLDKLSSIPGYNVTQSEGAFKKIVSEVGCAIVGQSASLAPADKILYSIRDVTGTVDSIDLITASILSKKLAGGIKNLILDVKVGNGSFMKKMKDAENLANSLVSVANSAGCKTRAFITGMEEPLNSSVGNALEVKTSIDIMLGKANDPRLLETTIDLSVGLYLLTHPQEKKENVRKKIKEMISSGHVAERFEKMVSAQGGKNNILTSYSNCLPQKDKKIPVFCKKEGYIEEVNTKKLGMLLVKLGGGRKSPNDKIDYGVGFSEISSINEFVDKRKPILFMHVDDCQPIESIEKDIQDCFIVTDNIKKITKRYSVKRVV